MKKIILILIISFTVGFSQRTFKVEKLSGHVKILSGNSNFLAGFKTSYENKFKLDYKY